MTPEEKENLIEAMRSLAFSQAALYARMTWMQANFLTMSQFDKMESDIKVFMTSESGRELVLKSINDHLQPLLDLTGLSADELLN